MSKKEIYQILRSGGLSRAGALGMMGNIGPESGFKSDIVEKTCPMSDWDYTHNVNIGAISKEQFSTDGYGYGLCQWTLSYRKRKLWDYAYMDNSSIGDETMQTRFILNELTTEGEYSALYKYLCTTQNMNEAVQKICDEYERPAEWARNLDGRIKCAQACANEAYDDPGECDGDSCPIDIPPVIPPIDTSIETCEITVRVLKQGMKGRDVFVVQTALSDMGCDCGIPDGDFGPMTESGVKDFQNACNLDMTGIVGNDEWQIIFQ